MTREHIGYERIKCMYPGFGDLCAIWSNAEPAISSALDAAGGFTGFGKNFTLIYSKAVKALN